MEICIDRFDEIRQISELCQGLTRERVFLIVADSGWGKSIVVQEFIAKHPAAIVDFKDAGINLPQIVCNICDSFGWEKFPAVSVVLEKYAGAPVIEFSENNIIGVNKIASAITGIDTVNYDFRQEELTKAFFTDVRALGKITVIFDVFENCDPTIFNWIINSFLPYAHRSSNLSVLIAGKTIPEPSLNWSAKIMKLEGIALVHWITYVRQIGLAVSDELVRAYWRASGGHPLRMLQLLESEST